jgi:hypothetical protein
VESGMEGIRGGNIGCVTCVGRAYFTGGKYIGSISAVRYHRITGGDRATYVHLGRTAAIILAPSTPRMFDARLRLIIALILDMGISDISGGYQWGYPLTCWLSGGCCRVVVVDVGWLAGALSAIRWIFQETQNYMSSVY